MACGFKNQPAHLRSQQQASPLPQQVSGYHQELDLLLAMLSCGGRGGGKPRLAAACCRLQGPGQVVVEGNPVDSDMSQADVKTLICCLPLDFANELDLRRWEGGALVISSLY